ncbi:MAG: chloride channel protein [Planctomycetota bacterium]|jgi:CIC family chloride channel protein|nr:chloride channel protein [Planctomycetota bacterium]
MKLSSSIRNADSGPWLMVLLAAAVGLVSSVVAVALRSGVHHLFNTLEAFRAESYGFLLPAVGALLAVWTVRVIFREPGGHGVPAVLDSVSRRGGHMRSRSIFSRFFGSLLTVASGGSAGLEGPIVFSSAAAGSSVAGWAQLAERQRVLLLACGVAGGIGAVFNAPLTGVLFAMEVVLAEWTLSTVIPLAVASVVATEAGRAVLGGEGAFHSADFSWDTVDLLGCVPLGILAGLLSVLLVRLILRAEHFARTCKEGSLLGRVGVVAALAGMGVGFLGLLRPEAIGEGYDLVAKLLEGNVNFGWSALILILGTKFFATVLTLGSNAPGGVFAPSLVLGALLGSSFGLTLAALFPGAQFAAPGFFALAGMAGLVAGTMQAPFTGILLALETTGGWGQSLPLILVAVLGALVSRTFLRHSFYAWEVAESGRLLRPGTDRRILADLTAEELLDSESITIDSGKTLEDLAKILPSTHRNHFAVLDGETGKLQGMLDLSAIREFIFDQDLRRMTSVDTVMDSSSPSVVRGDSLQRATQLFEESGLWVLPVVDESGIFLGTLSKSTLFDRYRSELIIQTAERAE